MDKDTLIMVGEWAKSRVASGEEPPWTFHKLKQLANITQDLAEGMCAIAIYDEGAPAPSADNVVQLEQFRPAATKSEVALPT